MIRAVVVLPIVNREMNHTAMRAMGERTTRLGRQLSRLFSWPLTASIFEAPGINNERTGVDRSNVINVPIKSHAIIDKPRVNRNPKGVRPNEGHARLD